VSAAPAPPEAAGSGRRRGLFVSFEGIDGSGKSTQARMLAERLAAAGHAPLLTREPGGSPGAEEIRRLLVEGDPGRWSPQTDLLLFTAARRDHLEKRIAPALREGRIVVCDRFADSTRVYQGLQGLRAKVEVLHAEMIGIEPDLTVLIDMDPARAAERGRIRASLEDRFETMGLAFQSSLRDGFLALAGEFPGRIRRVDGDRDPEAVHAEIAALVDAALMDAARAGR